MSRTASGGSHLFYQYNGEKLHIRVARSIDLLSNGGFVVVPNSRRIWQSENGANVASQYRFELGGWRDISRLPQLRQGALEDLLEELGAEPTRKNANHNTTISAVGIGQRNDRLFSNCLKQAASCGSSDELIAMAATYNATFLPPLPPQEVVKTAISAWRYQQDGRNIHDREILARKEVQLDLIRTCPDAMVLLQYLKLHHPHRNAEFAVAPDGIARAEAIGNWAPKRIRNARNRLLDSGLLVQVYTGGSGRNDPSQYTWGKGDEGTYNIT